MYINFWYVAAQSKDVTNAKPLKTRMLGHDFALWRDTAGAVHCVSNTCTHRSGALGDGKVNGDCIECPYHGWTFNAEGNCVRIPSIGKDGKIPERTRVDAYPVQEKYGLVHVFLGDLPEQERPPLFDLPEATSAAWYGQTFTADWKVDYKRSVENTLDPAHNEFVHDTHGFAGRNEDYKVGDVTLKETAWGSGFMLPMYAPRLPDEKMHEASKRPEASWAEAGSGNHGPNVTWTYIHLSPQAMFHNFTFHTPMDAMTDRLYVIMYRNFMHDPKNDANFEKRFWHVAEQDRIVLEGMAPTMTPEHNRHEFLVPSDACVARYRELCHEWEQRGWRLDRNQLADDAKTVAYAIPSPGRRERPKGWVLPVAPFRNVVAALLLAASALFLAGGEPARAADAAPAMTAEQQVLADRMQAFQDKTEKEFFERVKKINGRFEEDDKVFDYDMATHSVKVARGKIIQKAGWYTNVQKKGMPPMVPDPLFSRYLEMNVHPATPHVGMLHATMYFTYLKNGAGLLAGYMDYVPGVVHEDDNQRLKEAVDRVFAKYNEDISRFRTELCDSEFGKKSHRDTLRAACVGVSLYARPMMKVDDRNMNLAMEAFEAFTGEYFRILDERKRQRGSAADLAAQAGMRKRWLEDQLFADTFSRKVVPYEVWSLANLPPEVRF